MPEGGCFSPIAGAGRRCVGLIRIARFAVHRVLWVISRCCPVTEVGETAPLPGDLRPDAGNLIKERVDLAKDIVSEAIQSVVESPQVRPSIGDPALANLDRQQELLIDTLLRRWNADQSA